MEYFAKIQEPKKLRLSMMQSARESIIMISLLEEIESIRQKKIELIEEIKDDFKSAGELSKAMSELIGDEKTRHEVLESFKLLEKGEETKEVKTVPKLLKSESKYESQSLPKLDVKTKTEVDRLEYTLKQIEDRISGLSK